jgi:hypothetical protein
MPVGEGKWVRYAGYINCVLLMADVKAEAPEGDKGR